MQFEIVCFCFVFDFGQTSAVFECTQTILQRQHMSCMKTKSGQLMDMFKRFFFFGSVISGGFRIYSNGPSSWRKIIVKYIRGPH